MEKLFFKTIITSLSFGICTLAKAQTAPMIGKPLEGNQHVQKKINSLSDSISLTKPVNMATAQVIVVPHAGRNRGEMPIISGKDNSVPIPNAIPVDTTTIPIPNSMKIDPRIGNPPIFAIPRDSVMAPKGFNKKEDKNKD